MQRTTLSLAISLALSMSISASAQDQENDTEEASGERYETITVTSQRRVQNLNEVPIAVSAFDAQTVERANILDIEDVSGMTPGFAISTYNPTTPQPYIRGVGTNSSSVGDDASVGVFVDEVYAGRAGGYRTDMFDVERIEVLRGPQGSLYGRNVAGGAINVITKNPTEYFEGFAKLTYGRFNLLEAQGMVSGPLTERINGRLALSHRQRDGWVTNQETGNDNLRNQDNISVRGKLDIDFSDRIDFLISADYVEDDLIGPGARSPYGYAEVVGEEHPAEEDMRQTDSFLDGETEREIFGLSLQTTIDFDDLLFTSITAWREQDYFFNDDLFGRYMTHAGLAMTNDASEESSQFTQEFRLQPQNPGRLDWTAGAYLFYEDIDRQESFDSTFMYRLQGDQESSSRPVWTANNTTHSYALFGEATYALTEQLSLTAGGRYTYDNKDFSNIATGAPDLLGYLSENYEVAAEESWNSFTPKLTLNYLTERQDLFYATLSEGYKAGGFNGIAANAQAAIVPFDQEKARNYELGFKTTFFDRALRLNGALYHLDYTDLQSFTVDLDTGEIRTATGDAEISGLELEASAFLSADLYGFMTYAYTDSEYKTFASDPDIVGNRLARTPEHSLSAGFNYEILLNHGQTLNLRTDIMYQDDIYFSVNNDPAAADESRTLVNASLVWEHLDGWQVSLYGKNLTNEKYHAHAFASSGIGFVIHGEPRTWGISVAKSF